MSYQMSHPAPTALRLQNDGNCLMENTSRQPTETQGSDSANRVKTFAIHLTGNNRVCRIQGGLRTGSLSR